MAPQLTATNGLPARLEQAILHRLVEDVEPMPRRDQLEGQREEFRAIILGECRRAPRSDAAEDGLELGKIVRADKTELFKELVIGR